MITAATPPPRLFEILEQEIALSGEMLTLLAQEKTALVDVDVQGLIAISRRKNELLRRIQAADALLQEMSGQLLLGVPGAKTNLTAVLQQVAAGEERDRLTALRKTLLGRREEIIAKNTINRHFAEDTQRYLHDAISLITNAMADNHDSYQKGGKPTRRPPSANRPSLISRAV